jgi:hypothetical protein
MLKEHQVSSENQATTAAKSWREEWREDGFEDCCEKMQLQIVD